VSTSIATLVDRTLTAFDGLTAVAEQVVDETQYITDLGLIWRGRLNAVRAARGSESASDETIAAIDAASSEVARIVDPHRAIDWLSTLPQVALVALDEAT